MSGEFLDVSDAAPDRAYWIPATEIVRQVFATDDGSGLLRYRRRTAPPVVRVTDRFITSTLDLRGLEARFVLEFVRCRFENPPDLRQAALGGVEFHGCHLPGLDARNLDSKGDVLIDDSTVAGDAVNLTDATIGGSLTLRDCRIDIPDGDAVIAPRITIVGALLGERLRSTGSVRLPAARIQASLSLSGADLAATDGPALDAERVQVGDDIQLDHGFRAASVVLLGNATVDGSVRMADATFTVGGTGRAGAVELGGARILGGLHLNESTVEGGLDLTGTAVGSDVDLRGSHLGGERDTVLDLENAQIGRDLLCTTGKRPFTARNQVRVRNAEINRRTSFDGAILESGTLLDLYGLRTQDLVLTVADPLTGRVVLSKARCVSFTDNETLWATPGGVALDEFTYEALGIPVQANDRRRVRTRLSWLHRALGGSYQAAPYDQLITVLRTSGSENLATIAQIEKQRVRYRALASNLVVFGPVIRLASLVLRVGFGYGYRISLAVLWLLFLWALGTAWFATHPALLPVNPQERTPWSPVMYTLDLLVPLVDLGNKNRWVATGASRGVAATLTVMGWVLATTIAAELTRVLRRPG